MSGLRNIWQAVALEKDIGHRPQRFVFNGLPIVIYRNNDGLAALADRCPHRFARLSDGRVIAGDIECPYHGWRFDGAGRCTAIPGYLGTLPTLQVKRFEVSVSAGIVFVSDGVSDDAPYHPPQATPDRIVRLVRSTTRSTLVDTAENILDATHTHFTHKGLLRGLTARRSRVSVDITAGHDWVEARYTGEERQQGLVSRLLEGHRSVTIGRFRRPGIAELEYWSPKGLALATVFQLRQSDPETVDGIGWLIGPRQGGFGYLKALAFKPMFRVALEQDRRVLSSALENVMTFDDPRPVTGPLDFLRADIAAIAEGREPESMGEPRHYEIEL